MSCLQEGYRNHSDIPENWWSMPTISELRILANGQSFG